MSAYNLIPSYHPLSIPLTPAYCDAYIFKTSPIVRVVEVGQEHHPPQWFNNPPPHYGSR